jgi:hypothetical protein
MFDSFSDWALLALGLGLLVASIVAIAREPFREKPRRAVIATGFGLALLGVLLSQSGRIAKITTAGGTVELVAKAKGDAAEIEAIRSRVESQSATIDLVVEKAGSAEATAAEADRRLVSANDRIGDLDKTIEEAKQSLATLTTQASINSLLFDAENDDRRSYDKLRKMVADGTADDRIKRMIYDMMLSRATALQFQYSVNWRVGIVPEKLSFNELFYAYNAGLAENNLRKDTINRLALVQYIASRLDLAAWQRIEYFVYVMKNDPSLRIVVYALKAFDGLTLVASLPLDGDDAAKWWDQFGPVFWGP